MIKIRQEKIQVVVLLITGLIIAAVTCMLLWAMGQPASNDMAGDEPVISGTIEPTWVADVTESVELQPTVTEILDVIPSVTVVPTGTPVIT